MDGRSEKGREDWSAAARRQRELADILAADLGNSHYRAIDARNEQAYLERLASLKPEEARKLAQSRGKILQEWRSSTSGEVRRSDSSGAGGRQGTAAVARQVESEIGREPCWLGYLYKAQGDYARAEPLLRQALEIRKKVLGENHPDYAHSERSGGAVQSPRRLRAGRAALPPGPGDPQEGPRGEPPRLRHQPEQSGHAVQRPRQLRAGRAALPSGLEIRKKSSGRTTPIMPTA